MYKTDCRGCGESNLKLVISLGKSPLANNLLSSSEETEALYPLEMMYCPNCHNCQLSYTVPSGEMFDNYLYVSSTSKSFRDHFAEAADKYISLFNLTDTSLVIDIGSNDGIALAPLKAKGIRVLGIEPAKNITEIARENGIETMNTYFTNKVADEIVNEYGHAEVITASNVFAHADGLEEIANAAFKVLRVGGTFVVEVQYLLNTIKDLTFDNIYHEHVNYWSVMSINNFFNRLGYTVYKVEHVNTHGGSIRVYVTNKEIEVDNSVAQFLTEEKQFGLDRFDTYLEFGKKIEQTKYNTIKNLQELKRNELMIVGYGSPAKATTVLNYYGITTGQLTYIIEDNKLKHNKIVPGVRIPIYSREKLEESKPDIILVMAWNFFEEIKKNNQHLIEQGIKFINIKDLSV